MARQTTSAAPLQALKQAIQEGSPKPCYIFWGEETYLLQHYLELLRKKLIDPVTEEFNYHRFSSETFSMDALTDSVENLPMMADRSMVRVDDVDLFKLAEKERERLIALLSDLPSYCCVVFAYGASEYKPDRRQKKLYGAVSQFAAVVEFPKQSQRDLTAWIIRHFKSTGKTISPALCTYLIEVTGGTMSALAGEIGKIAAFAPGPEIRKSDVDAVTEPVLDAVVFQMTDALGAGNYEAALRKLQELYRMQQEPIAILGAVGAHMRRISAARILLDEGKGVDDLIRICGLKDYAAKKTMSAARKFPSRFCRRAAGWILETDSKMKTSFDEPERLLELCLLQLAQEAEHG